MNILFLNNGRFAPVNSHTMYSDLMREFYNKGHNVYVVSANERRNKAVEEYYDDSGIHVVCIRIGNLTKCSLIEKTLTTTTIADKYIKAIRKYYSEVKFDLVIYPTPPITLTKAVEFVKSRDGAITYLLLKDIFPQNAIDIGLMSKDGIKGIIYRYFRKIEKKLYSISDCIGCMSSANVNYILKNNVISESKVEICPNCIAIRDKSVDKQTRDSIRKKYGLPFNKTILVYGGNLGKPQGIPFIIDCIRRCIDLDNIFFLIVGSGSEYGKMEEFFLMDKPHNAKLMSSLPKEDYDSMVGACDVGLIFLDNRFTIPNFPSRLLAYLQAKLPVLAATDANTDLGKTILEGKFGWWCESVDVSQFYDLVNKIEKNDLKDYGNRGYEYLCSHYSVEYAYSIINESIGRLLRK